MTIKARVQAGRLVVDEPTTLPEGTEVALLHLDPGDWLSDAHRQALHATLAESRRMSRRAVWSTRRRLEGVALPLKERRVRFTATARAHIDLGSGNGGSSIVTIPRFFAAEPKAGHPLRCARRVVTPSARHRPPARKPRGRGGSNGVPIQAGLRTLQWRARASRTDWAVAPDGARLASISLSYVEHTVQELVRPRGDCKGSAWCPTRLVNLTDVEQNRRRKATTPQ